MGCAQSVACKKIPKFSCALIPQHSFPLVLDDAITLFEPCCDRAWRHRVLQFVCSFGEINRLWYIAGTKPTGVIHRSQMVCSKPEATLIRQLIVAARLIQVLGYTDTFFIASSNLEIAWRKTSVGGSLRPSKCFFVRLRATPTGLAKASAKTHCKC